MGTRWSGLLNLFRIERLRPSYQENSNNRRSFPGRRGLLNGRLSENEQRFVAVYITLYKDSGIGEGFSFSGSDWNGLITMVRADVNVPEREDVLRLLEKIVRLETRTALIGGRTEKTERGRPYSYLYKFHFRNFVRRW